MVAAVATPFPDRDEENEALRATLNVVVGELQALNVSQPDIAREGRKSWSTIWRQMGDKTAKVDANLVRRLSDALDAHKVDLARKGKLPEGMTVPPNVLVEVTIRGVVNAGVPVLSLEENLGEVSVPTWMLPRAGRTYVVEVGGPSMAPFADVGDLLLVARDQIAEPGHVVIVDLPGDGIVCRRLVERGGRRLLVADAKGYKPISLETNENPLGVVTRNLGPRTH